MMNESPHNAQSAKSGTVVPERMTELRCVASAASPIAHSM